MKGKVVGDRGVQLGKRECVFGIRGLEVELQGTGHTREKNLAKAQQVCQRRRRRVGEKDRVQACAGTATA